MSEDGSIFLRHMDDVVDMGPDKCHRHRAIREMDNQMNQHIEMCGTATNFAENHRDQGTRIHWSSGRQVSMG